MPLGTRAWYAAIAGCAFLLAGCASGKRAQSGPAAPAAATPAIRTANSVCPISGRPVSADAPVAMYRNVVVGFCCPACVKPWTELSDTEKHQILTRIAPETEPGHHRATPRNPFR